jgi:hypothetical protein
VTEDTIIWFQRTRDSVISMELQLQAEWCEVHIVVGATDFCLLQNVQPGSGMHLPSSELGTQVLSGGKVAKA